jgi:hypothetical protein
MFSNYRLVSASLRETDNPVTGIDPRLTKNWIENTGFNPITCFWHGIWSIIALVFGVGLWIGGVIWEYHLRSHELVGMPLQTKFTIATVTLLLIAVAILMGMVKGKLAIRVFGEFMSDLHALEEYIVTFRQTNFTNFISAARSVLIDEASSIVVLQEFRFEDLAENLKISQFRRILRLFTKFGLSDGSEQSFFDQAMEDFRKKIIEKASDVTLTLEKERK